MKRIERTCVIPALLAALLLVAAAPAAAQIDARAISSYMKGAFLESRYDLVNAYSWYMYADRFAPGTPRIQHRLARVTLELGDMEKARSFAGKLLNVPGYDSDARLILAEAEYRSGNPEAALAALETIEDRPDVPRFDVLKFKGRIFLETDREDEALAALEEAASIFDDDLYVHYKLGFLYAKRRDAERSIASFRRAVELNPGLTGAHIALGSILEHEGRRPEAKEAYRRALDLEPDNQTALEELAGMYVEDGEIDEGIDLLERMNEEGLLDANGQITLGRFYYRADRRDEALGVFRRLLMEEGERPSLLRVVSELEIEAGNHLTAQRYLERLVRIEPDRFENYVGLLLVAFDAAGEPSGPGETATVSDERARVFLERAGELVDPENPDDNYLLGAINRKIEKWDEAEEFLLRAERLAPGNRRVLLEVATLYEQRGEYDLAIERLEQLHELFPDDPSLQNFFGYVLAKRGVRLDFAESLLRKALDAEPGNGFFLDSLGWIKYRQGDYAEAVRLLGEAASKAGEDAVIWEHLGDAWQKNGDRTKAIEAWEKSIDVDPGNESARDKLERHREGGTR